MAASIGHSERSSTRRTPAEWLLWCLEPRTARFAPGLIASAGTVVVAGLVAWAIAAVVLVPHPSGLFLCAVMTSAVLWGRGPALFAAILSAGASAFFFYPPIFDFRVASPQDLLDLIVFVIAAVVTSALADEVRRRRDEAERQRTMTANLYSFSRRLAGIAAPNDLLLAVLEHLEAVLGRNAMLLVPSGGRLVCLALRLDDRMIPDEVRATADRLWRNERNGDAEPGEVAAAGWRLRLLRRGHANVAVLCVDSASNASAALPASDFFEALIDQSVIAIERARLAATLEDARVNEKTEELREALLNSISHDLQTPLASILGSATALQGFGDLYDGKARADLVATIREEAERLNDFIGNILDLTRIRAGQLSPRLEMVEIADIVDSALRKAERALADHRVQVDLPEDLPMLRLDLFLMEHALLNVLVNAGKFSPKGSLIRISARQAEHDVRLDVSDSGIGIPAEDLHHIFSKFYRSELRDAKLAGTGLGLAICRAFVEANDGRVEAFSDGTGKGATFRITLPAADAVLNAALVQDE
jgi:two-component system sensor histidine kinase KdpD